MVKKLALLLVVVLMLSVATIGIYEWQIRQPVVDGEVEAIYYDFSVSVAADMSLVENLGFIDRWGNVYWYAHTDVEGDPLRGISLLDQAVLTVEGGTVTIVTLRNPLPRYRTLGEAHAEALAALSSTFPVATSGFATLSSIEVNGDTISATVSGPVCFLQLDYSDPEVCLNVTGLRVYDSTSFGQFQVFSDCRLFSFYDSPEVELHPLIAMLPVDLAQLDAEQLNGSCKSS